MPRQQDTTITRSTMVSVLMNKSRALRREAEGPAPRNEMWNRHEWAQIVNDLLLYSNWMTTIARHVMNRERGPAIIAARKTPDVPSEFWDFIGAELYGSDEAEEESNG